MTVAAMHGTAIPKRGMGDFDKPNYLLGLLIVLFVVVAGVAIAAA